MFPCWNPVLQILFQTILNLLHHQYSLMMSLNMKSQRFSTLNWITDAVSVNSFIWSGGLDMKVLKKKPLGYLPMNLLTLPTLFLISTPHILPNLVPFQFNRIHLSIFILFCYFPSSHIILLHLLSSHFVSVLLFSFLLSYFPFCYSHQNKVKQKQSNFKKKKIYQVHFMIHYIF